MTLIPTMKTATSQVVDVLHTWDIDELARAEGVLVSEGIPYGVRRATEDRPHYWICVAVADYDRAARSRQHELARVALRHHDQRVRALELGNRCPYRGGEVAAVPEMLGNVAVKALDDGRTSGLVGADDIP